MKMLKLILQKKSCSRGTYILREYNNLSHKLRVDGIENTVVLYFVHIKIEKTC